MSDKKATCREYAIECCKEYSIDENLWGVINNAACDGYQQACDDLRNFVNDLAEFEHLTMEELNLILRDFKAKC